MNKSLEQRIEELEKKSAYLNKELDRQSRFQFKFNLVTVTLILINGVTILLKILR